MKKLLTILLATLMIIVFGTNIFAEEPDTKSAEVKFTEGSAYEWSVPSDAIATSTEGKRGDVTVTKAILEYGTVLKITINGGEYYQTGTTTGLGSALKYNMVLLDKSNQAVPGYYVSYKIEQDSSNINVGDTNKSATLKSGEISKDDAIIIVPAGQASGADKKLLTPVVEALKFTVTGVAAQSGTYSDSITFTASIVDAD